MWIMPHKEDIQTYRHTDTQAQSSEAYGMSGNPYTNQARAIRADLKSVEEALVYCKLLLEVMPKPNDIRRNVILGAALSSVLTALLMLVVLNLGLVV